ncbi:DUF4340 domain-containing protein [Parvibaculum sp. MBR-TMA-1.3b-4.2]|jgi:hypothetical protein
MAGNGSNKGSGDFLTALREQRPLRNLVVLAALTVIVVIAAIVAVAGAQRSVATDFEPKPLFAGLADRLDKVQSIEYTFSRGLQGTDKIVITRKGDGVWRLPSRDGYPADTKLVKKALLGLSEMEAYEPRTANKKWHRNLGLLAPEDLGSAIRVSLKDADGKSMASLLVGHVPDRTVDAGGQGVIYVRRDGEDQTWLARGRLPLFKKVNAWLAPDFLGLDKKDIKSMTLWSGTDHPVVLNRETPETEHFSIANLPEGRVSRGGPVLDGVATALAGVQFDDVLKADQLNFPDTSPVVTLTTYDGLKLTLVMSGAGSGLWAKIDVATTEDAAGDDAATERAKALRARVDGWAYKMPSKVTTQVTQTMDLLTRANTALDDEVRGVMDGAGRPGGQIAE